MGGKAVNHGPEKPEPHQRERSHPRATIRLTSGVPRN